MTPTRKQQNPACTSTRNASWVAPVGPAATRLNHRVSREDARTPPSRRLTIVVRLRRASSPSVAAGQPLSPEVPGERTRDDRLDSRLRLTCLAAIRDGRGLARKTASFRARSHGYKPGPSSTIAHQGCRRRPRYIGTAAPDQRY